MAVFWKHLLVDQADRVSEKKNRRNIALVVIFSLLAGTLAKIPEIFGYRLFEDSYSLFYLKNLSLFIFPFIALYFLLTRKLNWKFAFATLGTFFLSAVIINIYPSHSPNNTEV
jgi:hypothetical protein